MGQRACDICRKVEREGGKQEDHVQPFQWSIIASQTPSNLVAQNNNNLLFFTILRAGWAGLLPYVGVTRTLGWLGHPNSLISNGCQGVMDTSGEQSWSCQSGDLTSSWTSHCGCLGSFTGCSWVLRKSLLREHTQMWKSLWSFLLHCIC